MLARLMPAVLSLLIANASTTLAEDSDEAAIQNLQSKQAASWNAHDASAYAALFTADSDVVNMLGWLWKGRDEIRSKLTDAFAIVFRESQLTITNVDVRKLTSSIAVAHVRGL